MAHVRERPGDDLVLGDHGQRARERDRDQCDHGEEQEQCQGEFHRVEREVIPVVNVQRDRVRYVVDVVVPPGRAGAGGLESVGRQRRRQPNDQDEAGEPDQRVGDGDRFGAVAAKHARVLGGPRARQEPGAGHVQQVPNPVGVIHDGRHLERAHECVQIRKYYRKQRDVVHAAVRRPRARRDETQQAVRADALHGDCDADAGQTIGVTAERFRAVRVAQGENAQRLEQCYVNDHLVFVHVQHLVVVVVVVVPTAGGSKRPTCRTRARESAVVVVIVGADLLTRKRKNKIKQLSRFSYRTG